MPQTISDSYLQSPQRRIKKNSTTLLLTFAEPHLHGSCNSPLENNKIVRKICWEQYSQRLWYHLEIGRNSRRHLWSKLIGVKGHSNNTVHTTSWFYPWQLQRFSLRKIFLSLLYWDTSSLPPQSSYGKLNPTHLGNASNEQLYSLCIASR